MRHRVVFFAVACVAAFVGTAAAEPPAVVLNEVLYDAAGADGGFQFVELASTVDRVVPLAGYRLEAGDGATPGRWRLLWTGLAGDVLPPSGRFVIGEGRVEPLPDRVLPIDLENGPDAVRLTAPDGSSDVLGYGALTWAGSFEGRPAEDVPGGFSLARRPDAHDTDDNAADFVALSPATPGAPNQPELDAALFHVSASAERLEPGEPVTLTAMLENLGAGPLAAHEIEVLLWAAPRAPEFTVTAGQGDPVPAADSLVARLDAPGDLDPGDSLRVALTFTPPAPGAWDVALQARALDDGAPANDRGIVRLQVGPGALIVNEVEFAPADGGPEWVELKNVGGDTVVLHDWTLEDATGRRATVLEPGPFGVEPESLIVFTSDPQSLLARHPSLPPSKVAACQPWPALNNTASGAGPADRVVVRAPGGRVSDAMDLPGAGPPGASLERRSATAPSRAPATWGWGTDAAGTPGSMNSIDGGAFVPGVALEAPTRSARPADGTGALLRYRTGFERATVSLGVYDLRGRLVRALLDRADGPGQAGVAWDGRGADGAAVEPGVYVAGLEARDTAGSAQVARARTWVVVR